MNKNMNNSFEILPSQGVDIYIYGTYHNVPKGFREQF